MTTIVTLFQNRFGDKEPSPVSRNDEKTTLYVVVDQEKIKTTEVVKTPVLQTQDPEASRSVKYSILQIIPFVNNKDVLRYLPDNMLWRQGTVPCLHNSEMDAVNIRTEYERNFSAKGFSINMLIAKNDK